MATIHHTDIDPVLKRPDNDFPAHFQRNDEIDLIEWFLIVLKSIKTVVIITLCFAPVSYTHLDVYKRQQFSSLSGEGGR